MTHWDEVASKKETQINRLIAELEDGHLQIQACGAQLLDILESSSLSFQARNFIGQTQGYIGLPQAYICLLRPVTGQFLMLRWLATGHVSIPYPISTLTCFMFPHRRFFTTAE